MYIAEEHLEEILKSQSASKDHIITMRQYRNKVNYYATQFCISQACGFLQGELLLQEQTCFTNQQSVMLKK